ncbi:BMA-EAF-1 [Dirofilaria immitis]|nr:BMA-EAF-1 [Dirofilaria immitis]
MAEVREIPSGTYNLKLGESFNERGEKPVYHTLRFDFKPKSLAGEKETFIVFGGNGDVQVAVPGDGDALTVFKGAQKPVKGEKECLLFFDHLTGEMRIEKLSSIMSVKKTRTYGYAEKISICSKMKATRTTNNLPSEGNEDSASIRLRAEIERLRKESGEKSDGEVDDTKSSSSSSTVASSESGDSDSECDDRDKKSASVVSKKSRSSDTGDDDDDDDLQEALEQQLRSQSMPSVEETKQKQIKSYPPPPLQSNSKKLLHDDLQLSESSDED